MEHALIDSIFTVIEHVTVLMVVFYVVFRVIVGKHCTEHPTKLNRYISPRVFKQLILILCYGPLSIYATLRNIDLFNITFNLRNVAPLIAGMLGGPIAGIGSGLIGGVFSYFYLSGTAYCIPCSVAVVLAGLVGGLVHYYKKGELLSTWKMTLLAAGYELFHMSMLVFLSPLLADITLREAYFQIRGLAVMMIISNALALSLFDLMANFFNKHQEQSKKEENIAGQMKLVQSLDKLLPTLTNEVENKEEENNFDWLIPYMQKETYKADEMLIHKGDPADKVYYIYKGTLIIDELKKEIPPKALVGETGIFSPAHTRTVSIRCLTDIVAFSMNTQELSQVVLIHPELLFNLIQMTIKRYTANLTETVSKGQKIQSDLETAHDIQISFLPTKFPIYPFRKEFDVFALMNPAKDIGGDFYDIFLISEDHLCIVMADVSGKGIPAALFMVKTKTLLKTEANASDSLSPAKILYTVNNTVFEENEECMFVTILLAILNTETGELVYASAGHNPPLIKQKNKYKYISLPKSCVLGVKDNVEFTDQSVIMEKDDIFVTYTDGVTEAFNVDGDLFGNDLLLEKLNDKNNVNDIPELVNILREDVKEYAEGTEQSDDLTILAMKFNGQCTYE